MGMKKEIQQKIGKRDKKAESLRTMEKEKITSTELPEGGDTVYTKRTPGIPQGEDLQQRGLVTKILRSKNLQCCNCDGSRLLVRSHKTNIVLQKIGRN